MKELKFRAWDKYAKRMWWNVQNVYDTLGQHCCEEADCSHDITFFPESFGDVLKDSNLEVMQYTGLKDKNGNPIYEGDIVKIHNYSTRWKRGEPDGDWRKFKVFWNKCNYAYENEWVYMPFSDYNLNTLEQYDIEIIGNIYENPELLENK